MEVRGLNRSATTAAAQHHISCYHYARLGLWPSESGTSEIVGKRGKIILATFSNERAEQWGAKPHLVLKCMAHGIYMRVCMVILTLEVLSRIRKQGTLQFQTVFFTFMTISCSYPCSILSVSTIHLSFHRNFLYTWHILYAHVFKTVMTVALQLNIVIHKLQIIPIDSRCTCLLFNV